MSRLIDFQLNYIYPFQCILLANSYCYFYLCIPISVYLFYFTENSLTHHLQYLFLTTLLGYIPVVDRIRFLAQQLESYAEDYCIDSWYYPLITILTSWLRNIGIIVLTVSAIITSQLSSFLQWFMIGLVNLNIVGIPGLAIFIAGMYRYLLIYHKQSIQLHFTIFTIASTAIIFPTILTNFQEETSIEEVDMAHICSGGLLITYCLIIYFQVSHIQIVPFYFLLIL
jgi:Ca2+/H+ antiporter